MSIALDDDRVSRARPLVAAGADTRPVFVDESGRRARWCRRLLAICTVVALAFVLTATVLGVAFARSTGARSWTAQDRLGAPAAVSTAAVPGRPAVPGTGP